MPLRRAGLVWVALAVAFAGPARADKLLFSGEHAIKFSHNGVIKQVQATGTGVAIVNRAGSSLHLNTLEITRPFVTAMGMTANIDAAVVTMGTAPTGEIDEVRFKGVRIDPSRAGPKGVAGAGIFKPIFAAQTKMGALTQSTLPAAGTIQLCFQTGCNGGTLMVDLAQKETTPGLMTYAIGPGVGTPFTVMGTPATLTVEGAPWKVTTAKAKYVNPGSGTVSLSSVGYAKGPANKAGTTLANSGMGGMVQLVTPIQTTCAGSCGSINNPAAQIARLTITFAPEPSMLVLFFAGAIGVALLGRTRMRR